ncbi:MAG: hypothetical protein V1781_01360 [Bacteroidota bacterium]
MQIIYKFISDVEPTDEQLHLLMQEVAVESKNKAQKTDKQFLEQLLLLVQDAQKRQLTLKPDAK